MTDTDKLGWVAFDIQSVSQSDMVAFDRQLDQQTDRQTVRPTDRQTVRPTDRQTDS